MQTIGFFGDSYCSNLTAKEGDKAWGVDWSTYIEIVSSKLNAEVVHLGKIGSSIWDNIILQLFEYINVHKYTPDICVFCWTEPTRIFHRENRKISIASLEYDQIKDPELRKAVEYYYKYLQDLELDLLKSKMALYYVDKEVLSLYAERTKFIHIFSNYGNYYMFTNGNTVPNDLYSTFKDRQLREQVSASNHIFGQENNEFLANIILDRLENYGSELKLK